jgi:hypothetical protein
VISIIFLILGGCVYVYWVMNMLLSKVYELRMLDLSNGKVKLALNKYKEDDAGYGDGVYLTNLPPQMDYRFLKEELDSCGCYGQI